MKEYKFKSALPVWAVNEEETMNYHLVFRTVVSSCENAVVKVSASNMYQMFINGEFVSEGPARAGHGYYRVDEIDVSSHLTKEKNVISFFVAGYYVENFYLIKQPSFLCAEVVFGGEVVAATGKNGFEAKYNEERVRKTARFSYQRTFSEYYKLDGSNERFINDFSSEFKAVDLSVCGEKKFLEREVPYPCYDGVSVSKRVSLGMVEFKDDPINPNRTRFVDLTPDCAGFPLGEVEVINTDEIEKGVYTKTNSETVSFSPIELSGNEYSVFKFEGVKCGFIRLKIEVSEACELMAVFDELDVNGDVETYRMREIQASVIWKLPRGEYTLVSNEPYIIQYLKIINKSTGKLKIEEAGVIQFKFDYESKPLSIGNERLERIYDAAVETFRQNVLDIYMDCASRERAGWLCDSFFTSRVEKLLTGKSVVEKNFLENFLMPKQFDRIEKGPFPMCYPADFLSGEFIPNWAMWYVLELEEYYERTGDRELVELAREKIYSLLEYFEGFENEDGLIENLRSWVFVEWSAANAFTAGVNYPSNMLYSRMLESVGKLYDEKFLEKSLKIRKTINAQSYFDGFYHDHALRNSEGKLEVAAKDVSETCQYYAFYMGCATREMHGKLLDTLIYDFGPDREADGKWNWVHPSNAFIGNYLRLDILCNEKLYDKVLDDIDGFFYHMVDKTGTLWEHQQPTGSCSHAFASHVIVWLHKIFCQDSVNK